MPKGYEMLTSPQLEGQWAMEAADGRYSIPPSPEAPGACGMAAMHASTKDMAKTIITSLEPIVAAVRLYV
nr:unnamed protein product [Digitaria exilis]